VSKGHILVVDDESAIRDLISEVLNIAGFQVTTSPDGLDALNQIRRSKFDLILLDVNLPKVDGFAILEKVRESAPTQPIIMLSARTDKDDVVNGLRLGADDYVRKPFSVEELVLRVENRLKRDGKGLPEIISCGPITLNYGQHRVTFNDIEIDLSPTEFNLLLALMQSQNRVLSKEKLLDVVWGMDFETTTNVVDTYISYLRKKLHKDGFEGIKTVRGVGFKIETQ
jgi:two-component system OmpR family response regulator